MAADPQHFHDGVLAKLFTSLAGSLVSLKFIRGTWTERVLLCFGGAVLSYHATPLITKYFEVPSAEGLVGFALGLFGMALMAKIYEAVEYIDLKPVVDMLMDLVKKRIGRSNGKRK